MKKRVSEIMLALLLMGMLSIVLTQSLLSVLVGPVRAEASEETLGIYNLVESLPAGSVAIISFDFGPATQSENYPQAKACLLHCKQKELKVIGVAFWATGAPIGEDAFREVYGENFETLPEYGTEFVHLGFVPGGAIGMSAFADDVWGIKPVDHFGNLVSGLPLMDDVRSAKDFDFWMEVMSGTPGVEFVIMYVQTPYGGPAALPVGAGCTEVTYPGIKPFYDGGLLIGILKGFQAAFEYEVLLGMYIYIRPDGLIEGTDKIQKDGDVYTFIDDIYNTIVVQRDNIVVDGAGYTVHGTGSGVGIYLSYRNNVTLENIEVTNFQDGIFLDSCSNNILSGNTAYSNNYAGIRLGSCSNNTLSGNIIANNNMGGIYLGDSSNNKIFHNNIINNTIQASVTAEDVNTWDNGYPSGGNYWSDYTGVDEKSGSNQDQPNSDGIGDTPYVIEENNTDHYPLMNPWGVPRPRNVVLSLSGEHDYLYKEEVKIRVAALVTDAETMEPVSGANVTIEIFDPKGNLWISDNMTERLPEKGVYEWQSNKTIKQLMKEGQLHKGVYLVYVQASYHGGLTATAILEFHVDPPTELNTMLLITIIGIVAGIVASGWYLDHRRLSRKLHESQETKH